MTYLEYYFSRDKIGNLIFYPWGNLGSGGVIVSEDQKARLSRLVELKLGAIIIGSPFVTLVLLNITSNLIVLLLGILIYSALICSLYYYSSHEITKKLLKSDVLSFSEKKRISNEQQSKFLTTFSFFKIFSGFIVFIILGLFGFSILHGNPKDWLGAVFLISLSFVMLFSLVYLTLRKLKDAKSKTRFASDSSVITVKRDRHD